MMDISTLSTGSQPIMTIVTHSEKRMKFSMTTIPNSILTLMIQITIMMIWMRQLSILVRLASMKSANDNTKYNFLFAVMYGAFYQLKTKFNQTTYKTEETSDNVWFRTIGNKEGQIGANC